MIGVGILFLRNFMSSDKSLKFSKKRFYFNFFRERGMAGKREGEKHQCVVAFKAPPTGDLTCNPGMCPNWELNWQPFGLQAGAQSTGHISQGTSLKCCLNVKDFQITCNLFYFPLLFLMAKSTSCYI